MLGWGPRRVLGGVGRVPGPGRFVSIVISQQFTEWLLSDIAGIIIALSITCAISSVQS